MDLIVNAISIILGTFLGGFITYYSSIKILKNQYKFEKTQKTIEVKLENIRNLYLKVNEYRYQLNKCFWEAQDTEKYDEKYYIEEGKTLRRLLDNIKYLSMFTNISEKTYENYQKDLYSFWRIYTQYIGENKFEGMKEIKIPKTKKEQLADSWAMENSILKKIQEEAKSTVKAILEI